MKTTSFRMASLKRKFQPEVSILGGPVVAAFLAASSFQTGPAQETVSVRARLSFNEGWRFIKGDPAEVGDKLRYSTIKPWVVATGADFTTNAPVPKPEGGLGEDVTYAQAAFDDSAWRTLNLPHDWGVEGAFKQELSGNTGRLPWAGIGWYRKHFTRARGRPGQTVSTGSGRGDGLRDGLAERQICRWLALRLLLVLPRSHAVHQAGRREHPRDPIRQPAEFIALVSGRRHLSERLAAQDRPGPRRPMGHLCHHAPGDKDLGKGQRQGQG